MRGIRVKNDVEVAVLRVPAPLLDVIPAAEWVHLLISDWHARVNTSADERVGDGDVGVGVAVLAPRHRKIAFFVPLDKVKLGRLAHLLNVLEHADQKVGGL